MEISAYITSTLDETITWCVLELRNACDARKSGFYSTTAEQNFKLRYQEAQAYIAANYPVDLSSYPFISQIVSTINTNGGAATSNGVANMTVAEGDVWFNITLPSIEGIFHGWTAPPWGFYGAANEVSCLQMASFAIYSLTVANLDSQESITFSDSFSGVIT